jgi:hypothetical protein
MDEIINRVEKSGLLSLDLESFIKEEPIVIYDLKQNLYQGLILKEKDFREFTKNHDWSQYTNKNVGVVCTIDAIIPKWVYMIIASKITPFAKLLVFGSEDKVKEEIIKSKFSKMNLDEFNQAKLVIKGCSDIHVPESAYLFVTSLLLPRVSSMMFGEPCSTVPVYKAKM